MAAPLQMDIPHKLGREEARRRIAAGLPKLESKIPGGGKVEAQWHGAYQLTLNILAMGQTVSADLRIEEANIHASVAVPLMLSMMAGAISGFVRTSAEKMLEVPRAPADGTRA